MTVQHLIHKKQLEAKPSGMQTLEERRNADMNANAGTVMERLEEMGYDPLAETVDSLKGRAFNEYQKWAINRELLKYCYPQQKAVELSGKDGGPIPLLLTQDDAEL